MSIKIYYGIACDPEHIEQKEVQTWFSSINLIDKITFYQHKECDWVDYLNVSDKELFQVKKTRKKKKTMFIIYI